MPFVPNADVIRISLDWRLGGEVANNVFYAFNAAADTPSVVQEAAEDAVAAVITNMLPVMSADVEFLGATAYSMASETAPTFAAVVSPAEAGGTASDLQSRAFSVISTLRTQNRGRSGRGRIYWPGAAESQTEDGQLTSGALTAWGAAQGGFFFEMSSNGFPVIVYSQYTGGAPRTEGLAQLVVTAEIRSPRPGQQRRRNHRP